MADVEDEINIRAAAPGEVGAPPEMQVSAGQLFRQLGMALVADGPVPEVAAFQRAQQKGHLLVAVHEGCLVGFVLLDVLDAAAHVEQVTVAAGHGGQGIGRRLMLAAEEVAREQGYDRMTLTAFRDVPFNGPFYESLGWHALPTDGLPPALGAARQEEAEVGLDAWPRQAMDKRI